MLDQAGKLLILFGVLFVAAGLILIFFDKIPFLGKLPGDVSFRYGSSRVYIPVVSCIILSVIITIVINLIGRWK